MAIILAFLFGVSLVLAPWAWLILLFLALPWWAAGWVWNQIKQTDRTMRERRAL
jgi:hypothetical protein